MARYKPVNYEQDKLIPIRYSRQILPGSFEYTLSELIDNEIDLSVFDARYRNDETGAPAYDPAILLKIILYAYSRGITSSREIERCCRENVIFMALSADTTPHFTTLADFVSTMGDAIMPLFLEVLLICDDLKLIGREMFAIDGCKLPSNASKEWSGTKAELANKQKKMQKAIRYMLTQHRQEDARGVEGGHRKKEQQQIKTLRASVKKIKDWLKDNDDKPGKKGPQKSNITDRDSAKMKTSHGVVQGYDAVAAVDAKHQIVVHAQAFGEAQEHALLAPMVKATRENFQAINTDRDVFATATLVTDSGFHTEANVHALFEQNIDAYIADNQFRKRDPRFAGAERYRARAQAERTGGKPCLYRPRDFIFDAASRTCICPAGKRLYGNGSHCTIKGYIAIKFQGAKRDCAPCPQRAQCLRDPQTTLTRQVAFLTAQKADGNESYTNKMKRKIDSAMGRAQYSRRIAIVEPVFGHIRSALGLDRLRLRGKRKVDIQWKLYCIVHNLIKIHRYGMAAG